jgi:hypothetical protein
VSQPELFDASRSDHEPADDASPAPDDGWAQLMERQRAYVEQRREQQRRSGLKRRAREASTGPS